MRRLLFLFLILFLAFSLLAASGPEQKACAPSEITRVIFLGTGTPNPDPEHSGISVAIVVGEVPYIIDFGPGLVRKAAALSPEYGGKIAAMDTSRFNRVFLTHLHADHTMGYPDLIITTWIAGRNKPLEVYGPKGISAMTKNILEAYKEDIRIRISGSEPINDQGWMVRAHETGEGHIYTDKNVRVEAFLVEHGSLPEAYGYKFTTPDRTIAISGDTRPCKNLVDKCKNVDILIHEVYSFEKFKERPEAWQAYHKQFHTSTIELAEIASQVKPGLLILYHQLYWGAADKDLIREIKEKYSGPVVSAQDLDIF